MSTRRIITRAQWGAKHAPGPYTRPLGDLEVWAHHTVTVAPDTTPPFTDDHAAIRTVESITEQRFGWGMAYTFLITPAGLIFEGHPIESVGTHTAGHNRTGAAVAFVGNYENAKPTAAQLDAAAWLLTHGVTRGWWKRARFTGGHRDTKATACPGRHVYAALDTINRLARTPSTGQPGAPTSDPDVLAYQRRQNRYGHAGLYEDGIAGKVTRAWGAWVAILQAELPEWKGIPNLLVDEDYGPLTHDAVRTLQDRNGLYVDGIAGPKTIPFMRSHGSDIPDRPPNRP